MLPSFSFVGQPETNGVMERFFRTFKEQVVHGRIFRTIDVFRDADRDFVLRYNTQWLRTATSAPPSHAREGSTRICRVRHSATYCPRNRVRYIISVIRNFPYHLIGQHIGTFGGAADPRGRQALDPERAHHRLDLAGGGHRQMTVRTSGGRVPATGVEGLPVVPGSLGTCTDTCLRADDPLDL